MIFLWALSFVPRFPSRAEGLMPSAAHSATAWQPSLLSPSCEGVPHVHWLLTPGHEGLSPFLPTLTGHPVQSSLQGWLRPSWDCTPAQLPPPHPVFLPPLLALGGDPKSQGTQWDSSPCVTCMPWASANPVTSHLLPLLCCAMLLLASAPWLFLFLPSSGNLSLFFALHSSVQKRLPQGIYPRSIRPVQGSLL